MPLPLPVQNTKRYFCVSQEVGKEPPFFLLWLKRMGLLRYVYIFPPKREPLPRALSLSLSPSLLLSIHTDVVCVYSVNETNVPNFDIHISR